jgi:hypothetical protein
LVKEDKNNEVDVKSPIVSAREEPGYRMTLEDRAKL